MRQKSVLSRLAVAAVILAVSCVVSAAEDAKVDGTVVDRGSADEKATPADSPATAAATSAGEGDDDDDMFAAMADHDMHDEDEEELNDEDIAKIQREATEWAGNFKPLASVNTKIPVPELAAFPSPKEFFLTLVRESSAAVIRGGANSMPATTKWTDEYLSAAAGAATVEAYADPHKKENRTLTVLSDVLNITLASFIAQYKADGYDPVYQSDVLSSLKPDVELPASLQCGSLDASFARAILHLNNGGARSMLHLEHSEEIQCVLDGKKTFLLLNPATSEEYIGVDSEDAATGEYVNVDVDAVDALLHPGMSKVAFHTATLKKGDCIYIPSQWLHAESTPAGARAAAVSLWWASAQDVEEKIVAGDCAPTLLTPPDASESELVPPLGSAGWGLHRVVLQDEIYVLTPAEREELRVKYASEIEARLKDDAEAAEAYAAELEAEVDAEVEADTELDLGEGGDDAHDDALDEGAAAAAAADGEPKKDGFKDEL
jgi:hypothetical protein